MERSRISRVHSDKSECSRGRTRIAAAFDVEFVADPSVSGKPNRVPRKRVVDEFARIGRRRNGGVGERETPRGKRVPGILNGRVVVERQPKNESLPKQLGVGNGAKVDIVPGPGTSHSIIGHELGKAAEMVADSTGDEQARLVEHEIVIAFKCSGGGTWSLRVCVHEATAIAENGTEPCMRRRIATKLELAPKLREFGTEAPDMASRAIAAGLLGEGGNRRCRPVNEQRGPNRSAAGKSDHLVAMPMLVMPPFPLVWRGISAFAWYSMHHPAGLTWPSTTWQEVGDCHSAQSGTVVPISGSVDNAPAAARISSALQMHVPPVRR